MKKITWCKFVMVVMAISIVVLAINNKKEKARMNELIEWVESTNNRLKNTNEALRELYKWEFANDSIQMPGKFPLPGGWGGCY